MKASGVCDDASGRATVGWVQGHRPLQKASSVRRALGGLGRRVSCIQDEREVKEGVRWRRLGAATHWGGSRRQRDCAHSVWVALTGGRRPCGSLSMRQVSPGVQPRLEAEGSGEDRRGQGRNPASTRPLAFLGTSLLSHTGPPVPWRRPRAAGATSRGRSHLVPERLLARCLFGSGAAVATQSLLTVAGVRGHGTPVGAVSPRPPEWAPWRGATSQWDDLSHPGLAHLAGMAVPVATLLDTRGRNSCWASKGFLTEPLPRLGSEVGPAPRAPQRGGPVLPPTPGPSFMPRGLLHILGSGGLRTQAPPLRLPDALNGMVPMETGNLPSASASSGA